MNKIIRTLTFNDEISLMAVDSTQMLRDAIKIHSLSREAAAVFGKALTVMTYMSCWLKDEGGKISVNLKGNGAGGTVCVSGDKALNMRGAMGNPRAACSEREIIGHEGYITVIRDDGYTQPFVGTAPISSGSISRIFEEYYIISEQLPTYINADVLFGEDGKLICCAGIFLQPLPEASFEAKAQAVNKALSISGLAAEIAKKGVEEYIKENFSTGEIFTSSARYKCNCSKKYIEGVILAMGRDELEDILRKEGKVNVHCHYCNTDYDFYREDIEKLFVDESKS